MWKSIILDVECIVCNKSLQKINHDPREVSIKMGKIANRRSRTPNWSAEEKQYLLELIKERRVVITKNTNGPNHNEEKDMAWNEILRALINRYGNKFDGSSIKKVKTQWQNMKRIAREEITLNGPEVQKYTRQSLEVCHILELVKNGVLNKENEANLNETNPPSNMPNIEIKTERIDEEPNQPSCSNSHFMDTDPPQDTLSQSLSQPTMSQYESSSSSPDHQSEPPEYEPQEVELQQRTNMKNASSCTDTFFLEETSHTNPFSREFQEFMRFSEVERQLKLEALKEERHVVRAMRETAELNKIIAEQRLKHLLWVKKNEMAMYSGEPGSGAGKGGGGGGSIREAGGSFGKMEAVREDEYFYKKQREQIEKLKGTLDKEISFHQEQIKRHEDAIRRHKQAMADADHSDHA